jgi:hypothetical protein
VSAKPRPALKHIFCIEGNWDSSLAQPTTVRPVLELLEVNAGVKYIYRDCSTRNELDFLLDKWRQKGYGDYKILYLAFHGEPGRIIIDNRNTVSLDELAEKMPCRTSRRLVYFGACSVMRVDKRVIRRFIRSAGVRAACGYTTDVDWIPSTALDLIAMNELQRFSFTRPGLQAAEKSIRENTRRLAGRLGFRMVLG